MPKIFINEVDNTSAGTPGRYGNYSVLLTGYEQTEYSETEIRSGLKDRHEANRKALKDSNGVYEFSSVTTFRETIGETPIEKYVDKDLKPDTAAEPECHYGNKMAIELLNLGYTVIYKVIDKVSDMNTETFWEIFKDKASYDFRFISHGLLTTACDQTDYNSWKTQLNDIKVAKAKIAYIKETVDKVVAENEANANKTEEELTAIKEDQYDVEYQEIKDDYAGFKDNAGRTYKTFSIADEELSKETKSDELNEKIEAHKVNHVTSDVFNEINGNIAKLACYVKDSADIPGRGDCVALIELDENTYISASTDRPEKLIIDGINNMAASIADNGAYCALTVPSVSYKMNGKAEKFPGAFHYLACFMSSLRAGFAEWYAAAGYTRGVSSYTIDHTSVKLGEIAINALEPRNLVDDEQKVQPQFACNVIANFRGSYYLWGNRTAAKLGAAAGGNDLTAKHFLNIRQLCSTIKKQLYVACRRFTFDPNSDTLWFNFVNAITPTLDAMKADQGVRDYKIVKVATDKKATLKAKVRIIPIEAVEDFDLEVSLEDSFGGVSVTVEG